MMALGRVSPNIILTGDKLAHTSLRCIQEQLSEVGLNALSQGVDGVISCAVLLPGC